MRASGKARSPCQIPARIVCGVGSSATAAVLHVVFVPTAGAGTVHSLHGATILGAAFFVAMMATGYCYNLTFVQLGLVDLGTRVLGLSESEMALDLACFALTTAAVGLTSGWLLHRSGRGDHAVRGSVDGDLVVLGGRVEHRRRGPDAVGGVA